MAGQRGAETVEVHLAFAGSDARLQVSELGGLKDLLPDHGRRHSFFTRLEALDSHSDSNVAHATSSGWDNKKGLAVTRSGQRSAWGPLHEHDVIRPDPGRRDPRRVPVLGPAHRARGRHSRRSVGGRDRRPRRIRDAAPPRHHPVSEHTGTARRLPAGSG
jgi:hypothetical protein